MKNSLTATIEFHFKGELFTPSISLEIDNYMQSRGGLPDLCMLIAKENQIDLYSYEYEMMQGESIKISQAEGLVADFIVNDTLDVNAFVQAWHEQSALNDIHAIVERNMGINDLQQHPELKNTLLEVYHLGASKPDSQ